MSTIDPLTCRRVVIRGHVQGVGFRWFTQRLAESLGLAGWVRNREDGSVEAEVSGALSALDEFARRIKTGHSSARVDVIEMRPAAVRSEKGFLIK